VVPGGTSGVTEEIKRLCDRTEQLSSQLDDLVLAGHAKTAYALLIQVELTVVMAELITANLVERCSQVENK